SLPLSNQSEHQCPVGCYEVQMFDHHRSTS
ncbi:unnamed protein product, partial [Tetraodon nigroviridis]